MTGAAQQRENGGTNSMRWWEEHFRGVDGAAYRSMHRRQRRDGNPALLVIDVVRSFVGSPGLSLDEAIQEWPTACGPAAFEALPPLQRLLDAARSARVPVIYCRPAVETALFAGPTVKGELEDLINDRPGALDFPEGIGPREGELVIAKPKASAFFDTPLANMLRLAGIDSLLISGATISGCVRATVVDAFSSGFATFVVEEAVFDRSQLSAAVSLFEMDAKYADVLTCDDAVAWLDSRRASRPEGIEEG